MMAMERQEETTLQEVHPEALLLATELLGNLSSLQMPFNVQNLIGNWLQLIGQIILVFNAQQQLWQNGPGHYYSRCNKNIGNNMQTENGDVLRKQDDVQALQAEIAQLQQRLDALQEQIERHNWQH